MSIYQEKFYGNNMFSEVKKYADNKVAKKKLTKIKTYHVRKKDGSSLPTSELHHAAYVATAAYKENGLRLFDYYKNYAYMLESLIEFNKYFKKEFSEIYNSTVFSNPDIGVKKIGDFSSAKEIEEMWRPLDYVGYNSNWWPTWVKEMTYDDDPLIKILNVRQQSNNKKAFKQAKEYINSQKDPKDYVIYKTLATPTNNGKGLSVRGGGNKDIVLGDEDTND